MANRLPPLPVLALVLVLTACSGASPSSGERPADSVAPSAPHTAQPTATAAPRPTKNGCHRLTYEQAVAPVVSGTDVGCAQRHTSQTYKTGRLDLVVDGHLAAVDSPSVQAKVAATCTGLYGDHVGGSTQDRRLSMVQPVWFSPTVEEATAGADWFRCDVVALAGTERLAALPRSSRDLVGGSDRFAMCGTASPDAASFERVPCSEKHTWVALATVDLAGRSYPVAEAASDQMQSACRAAARSRAEDPLDFTWSEERPTRSQWKAGRRYGICWAPA